MRCGYRTESKIQVDWEFSVVLFCSGRRRHTRFKCDWSSDVGSSDLLLQRIGIDAGLTGKWGEAPEPSKKGTRAGRRGTGSKRERIPFAAREGGAGNKGGSPHETDPCGRRRGEHPRTVPGRACRGGIRGGAGRGRARGAEQVRLVPPRPRAAPREEARARRPRGAPADPGETAVR